MTWNWCEGPKPKAVKHSDFDLFDGQKLFLLLRIVRKKSENVHDPFYEDSLGIKIIKLFAKKFIISNGLCKTIKTCYIRYIVTIVLHQALELYMSMRM